MISKFLKAVEKFNKDTKQDSNSRYRSWEYCYTAFFQARQSRQSRTRDDKKLTAEDLDKLSLQLYQYLASWGMLRGSSFLLWKDYKIHIPVIKEMMKPEYDCLQGVTCQDFIKENVLSAWENLDTYLIQYYDEVRNSVRENVKNEVSDILRSKILLGTLGCTPAYDRFFVKMVRAYKISGGYGKNSFTQLANFYKENASDFEKCRQTLTLKIDSTEILYPQMKLLDMGFWQLGFEAEKQNKK